MKNKKVSVSFYINFFFFFFSFTQRLDTSHTFLATSTLGADIDILTPNRDIDIQYIQYIFKHQVTSSFFPQKSALD